MIKHKRTIKCAATFVILICIGLWLNPSLRICTEGGIRQNLIKKTPLGSQASQALNNIQERWNKENIVLLQRPGYDRGPQGYTEPVGIKSIGPIKIGWYWTSIPGIPMITGVFATWVFDENDRLIDVLVHKEIDAP